jgi:hypothetical protein
MNSKRWIVTGLAALIVGALLFAWWHGWWGNFVPQIEPQLAAPSGLGADLAPLSDGSWSQFEEVTVYASEGGETAVLALYADWAQGRLLSVDEGGFLHSWEIDSQALLANHSLNMQFEPGNLSFSADGRVLHTPAGVIDASMLGSFLVEPPRQTGIKLFDTISGEELRCYGMPCGRGDDWDFRTRGSLISPDAGYIFYYLEDNFVYYISELNPAAEQSGGGQGYAQTINGQAVVSQIALDSRGEYVAVSFFYGGQVIERLDLDREDSLGFSWGATTWIGEGSSEIVTQALAFDDTRTWLARLNLTQLSLWDLRSGQKTPSLTFEIESGMELAFERSGRYLFVGSLEGIQVYDLDGGTLAGEWPLGRIRALYVTPDNRLLLWGDDQGVVHAWGIKPQ